MAATTSNPSAGRVDSFVGRIMFRAPPTITTWRPTATPLGDAEPAREPEKRFSLLTTRRLVWGDAEPEAPMMMMPTAAKRRVGIVERLAAAWVAIGLLVAFSGISIGVLAAEKMGEPDPSVLLASIAPHGSAKASHVATAAWKAPQGMRSEVVDHDMLVQPVEAVTEVELPSAVAKSWNGSHARHAPKKHAAKKSHGKHGH